MDIQRILELMPHRYPFLLVDRILEFVAGERIKTLKNVTINEPFFQGHFPEVPIMPGVLIVEAMAQTGGLLYLLTKKPKKDDYIFYFMGMDKVRFRKPVVPGDQLVFDVSIIHAREKALKIAATATVEGRLAAQAELLAAIGERT
ncbi:MAG: 3-hydroxyacyl-ACP dehydratase [Deltaproteobacteria bacterium SG8_13]|nr:MAG: 3-hydroxyacyl-ACP dehydratase [Deltaproteobacteria bacterium SG8_13]